MEFLDINKKKLLQNSAVPVKKPKNKRFLSKFVAIALVVILLFSILISLFIHLDSHNNTDMLNNVILTDITDKTPKDEYGVMYYSPVDKTHISGENFIKYTNNEILIVTTSGVSSEQVHHLAAKYDAEVVGEIQVSGDYQLKLDKTYNKSELNEIAAQIEREEIIESASLNYIQEVSGTAQKEERNGFYFGKKWQGDLQNFNNAKGKSWGLEAIETFAAWDWLESHSESVKPVRLGLIDSGFDISHEDLKFAEVFYDNGANGVTSENTDHGTHVAGTMAADNSNTTGICGVYPYGSGRLYGVANVHAYSENGTFWNSVMAQKIAYAELVVRNIKVINQSQGFNWHLSEPFSKYNKKGDLVSIDYNLFNDWYTTNDFSEIENIAKDLGDFFNRMLKKGYDFVVVSTAGNSSDSSIGHIDCKYNSWTNMISREDYPDVFDRIIVVGAVDYNLNIAEYSNGGDRVDTYAPGGVGGIGNKKIYSTLSNNKYGTMSGTSMAAPHVSGVAAMVWSINNSLTGAQVKEIIRSSNSGRCTSCNMIDAYKAVQRAYDTVGKSNNLNAENGSILCYVVDGDNSDIKISGATVTAKNAETGEEYKTTTDNGGHFELVVPQGDYSLRISANGYKEYIFSENSIQYPIHINNGQVNYLPDWIKMEKIMMTDFLEMTVDEIGEMYGRDYRIVDNSNKGGVDADFSIYYDDNRTPFVFGIDSETTPNGKSIINWVTYSKIYKEFDCKVENGISANITFSELKKSKDISIWDDMGLKYYATYKIGDISVDFGYYDMPTDNAVAETIFVSKRSWEPSTTLEIYPNDSLTVTGQLKKENYEINSTNKGTVIILNLNSPMVCDLYDESTSTFNNKIIDSVQVSINESDYEIYKNKNVTISGNVVFAHTGHHLREIVLVDCHIE